jgi:hypothetical protein
MLTIEYLRYIVLCRQIRIMYDFHAPLELEHMQ